jgi:hypothetical protein
MKITQYVYIYYYIHLIHNIDLMEVSGVMSPYFLYHVGYNRKLRGSCQLATNLQVGTRRHAWRATTYGKKAGQCAQKIRSLDKSILSISYLIPIELRRA